jgi:hypothetical protein
MSSAGNSSKQFRFQKFLNRLQQAPNARNFEEAYQQVCNILNEVENELTDIPFNPEHWQTDGRMYPPQMDNRRDVPDHPQVQRLRSKGHNTFMGTNGSLEIQVADSGEILLTKPGLDGRGVWLL